MTPTEQSFSDWEKWFSENRSSKYSVLTTLDEEPGAFPKLVRLFTPQDGKLPKNGIPIIGSIWEKKYTKPRAGIIVLFSKGSHPLVLCPPEKTSTMPIRQKVATKTKKLAPPYHWRCRICSITGQSEELGRHCEVNVRQLSPVSEETKTWFQKLLDGSTFSFVSPDKLRKMPGMMLDPEKIDLANNAGEELERIFSEMEFSCPTVFEVFNAQTDHIRVSDLKKRGSKGRGFEPALDSSLKYADKPIPPAKKVPMGGPVEIGHVFDELMTDITNSIISDSWKKGGKVQFECAELGIRVTGTPDLEYNGIPVEMKTTRDLIVLGEESMEKPNTQKSKWNSNYLPQLAMYSDARGMEWMLLLLFSKETGRFSVIPVNPRNKLESLRKEWRQWSKDRKLMRKIEKYLEINPNCKIN